MSKIFKACGIGRPDVAAAVAIGALSFMGRRIPATLRLGRRAFKRLRSRRGEDISQSRDGSLDYVRRLPPITKIET